MQMAPPPPRLQANPTLKKVHEVERILRAAAATREGPLSYAEIGRRMSAKSVRFDLVKTIVQELARHNEVSIGSKGVSWVVADEAIWSRPRDPLE